MCHSMTAGVVIAVESPMRRSLLLMKLAEMGKLRRSLDFSEMLVMLELLSCDSKMLTLASLVEHEKVVELES